MTDEYIRKDDAASIIEKEMEHYVSDIWYKSATHSALSDVNENIKSLEPADVAPVVRCKDCLFFTTEKSCCRPEGLIKAREDDFCSYGERREE